MASKILSKLAARWGRHRLHRAGIIVGGSNPQDLHVHDEGVYLRVMLNGSLALGEEHEKGNIEFNAIDEFFKKLMQKKVGAGIFARFSDAGFVLASKLKNLQTLTLAKKDVPQHYNLGNKLFSVMLKETMQYSCAYFGRGATELTGAQRDKMRMLCEKLRLKKGEKLRVLDVGCGFGTLAKFMAEEYGVEVVGITLSEEQAIYARTLCEGLPVDIRVLDWREIESLGQFDRIVSVGMFEHVGPKNYDVFIHLMYRALKQGGIFVLHTIVGRGIPDRWVNKYIFSGGCLPRREQIRKAAMIFLEWDWHEFGKDYAKTLKMWWENFVAGWKELVAADPRYDERFFRRWTYYLLMCSGLFAAERVGLVQIVYAKTPRSDDYEMVR